ncbi:MAG: phosphoenolpyruvate carboxylase [Candidatus Saliniplasma sp.]
MKIPKCMSTQHPDNVHIPFFAENSEIGGEDEIKEAYYAFSHLGADEQMWDCEGKEADSYVVKKLLTRYQDYFRENRIGEDVSITLRVPNPAIEKAEAKILIETLESIPRSFDTSKLFYGDDKPPIFEVILPMTTSAASLDRIYKYYRDFVIGKETKSFEGSGMKINEWIGEFKPDLVNVIPLLEDRENMLNVYHITKEYLKGKNIEHQRVFLARSDTAMNYGNITAILLNKIALGRIQKLSEDTGVDMYPILGVGSAPFRGNLRPQTVEKIVEDYPSVHTFTIQSAFKYDNSPEEVREGIRKLKRRSTSPPQNIDEERSFEIIDRYSREYQKQIPSLESVINRIAKYVPNRRKRKLHVGLFGYSRDMGGITLPRAITFTAALYSIGLPPEILGLNALNERDLDYLRDIYINFDDDLRTALKFYNPDCPFIPEELKRSIEHTGIQVNTDKQHKEITDQVVEALKKGNYDFTCDQIQRAANLRGFLG